MSNTEADVDVLLATGIPVPGTSERALSRADALLCVSLYRKARVPILGGDVYYARERGLEPAYANWHTECRPGESRDEFVARSCDVGLAHLEGFPDRPGDAPVFVMVVCRD